jgi:ADP-ribose pyrophosphatase
MEIVRPASNTKRPADAKLVFKGEIFDVYQWNQKLYNGETAIFESLKRPDTVDVIAITKQGKIVIIHEEQPAKPIFISFPGGRVEAGEDVATASLRELKEETGYNAEKIESWFSVQPVSKIDWAIYVVFAYGCEKVSEQNLDAGEKIQIEEIDFEKFLELASSGKFGPDIRVRVLEAKMDFTKMEELKNLFNPQ